MIQNQKNSRYGFTILTICILINSYAFVFISHMVRDYNAFFSMLMIFGYATILFTLVNLHKLPTLVQRVKTNLNPVLLLNLVTFLSWLSAFIALKYIDPATKVALGFGIIAMANYFISTPRTLWWRNRRMLLCMFYVFVSMVLIVLQYAALNFQHHPHQVIIGLIWAIISGVTGGFIGIYSEKVGHGGFTPTQILATRFYMLILASLVVLVVTKPTLPAHINWHYYLFASILIVLLPLLLYQTAIQHLGAVVTAIFESFLPVVTYFMQIAIAQYQFHLGVLLTLILANASVLWLVLTERRA